MSYPNNSPAGYAIVSPRNSFVDFNPPVVLSCLDQPDISLPAFNDFGIQFQFQISGSLQATSNLKVVICDADGDIILDQGILAQQLCFQYRLSADESVFPLTVNAAQAIPAGEYDYPSFLTAISAVIGTDVPSSVFDYCCLFPNLTIATSIGNVTFAAYWDFGFAIFPQTNMAGLLRVGDCFRYGIADSSGNLLAASNKFRRAADTCFSTLLAYWNDDDAFGFSYPTSAFFNVVRLPFTFHKPVYPVVEQLYTKSDGSIKRASSRINKEYEGYTDVLTEYFHERLIVALKHDHVLYTNSDIGLTAQELFVQGDYKPDWIDDNTIVVAPAKFKISMPISDINNNCYSKTTIPCCPPFVVSVDETDESVTINVNFGMFTTSWNLRWRLAGGSQWNQIAGNSGRSVTISGLPPGTEVEYELQSVCGSTTGTWSGLLTASTTGTAPCDSGIGVITVVQNSGTLTTITWTVTGSAVTWWVYLDNGATPTKVNAPHMTLNPAIGNHTLKIVPICDNGSAGTPATQNFTTQSIPTLTLISSGTTGAINRDTFQVGPNIMAGNRFMLEVYSHVITVVALAGDTPVSIALKLVDLVNTTLAAVWNSAGTAPSIGTMGFPPVAFMLSGGQFFINLDSGHTFAGDAFLT